MPIKELKPAKPMDLLTRRKAKAATEGLMQEPPTEGTVYLRLGAMPRHQYRALCALVGDDAPQQVMDFAMRITGLRLGSRAGRRRLEECQVSEQRS
jgi:hypothetical protein